MSKKIVVLLICFSQSFLALSQTHLTAPLNKAVYQRNNDNVGVIPVSFIEFYNRYDSVQITLEDNIGNLPTVYTSMSLVEHTNNIDTFIVAKGGWYKLKVDYFFNKKLVNTEEVEHVGIGEIFLVTGQSNAEIQGPVATNEQVIGIYLGHVYEGNPAFISLTENRWEKLLWPSPPGTSFLGVLGDLLVKRLGVPVLFFSAASGGTSSSQWFRSSQTNEQPYVKINWVIDRFVREHGIRGVLWHQGEHNSLSYTYHPPKETYRDEILSVINTSRAYLNYDKLSWVIAQVSWSKTRTDGSNDPNDPNSLEFRTPTRDGQKLLTESDENIFLGPDTDTIEGYIGSDNRPDGTHFSQGGQILHGQLWNQALDDSYFSLSQPYLKNPDFVAPSIPVDSSDSGLLTGIDKQISCNTYIWRDGITYSASNNSAQYLITNASDRDSLLTLDLTIVQSNSAIDEQTAIDSLIWIDGKTYTENNNTASYVLKNSAGCDSTIILNLTINLSQLTATDKQIACNTFTWRDGITYTSSDTSAQYLITNPSGRDSLLSLDLTILQSDSSIDEQVAISSFTWIDGKTYTESNNAASYVLKNSVGCDSVITLILTIQKPLSFKTEYSESIVLFPNPTSNILRIKLNVALPSLRHFYIFDSAGKTLKKWDSPAKTQTIDISSFLNGEYLLKVVSENQSIVEKFIKKE